MNDYEKIKNVLSRNYTKVLKKYPKVGSYARTFNDYLVVHKNELITNERGDLDSFRIIYSFDKDGNLTGIDSFAYY